MKGFLYISFILLIAFSCKEENKKANQIKDKVVRHALFYEYEEVSEAKPLNTKRKRKTPFFYNSFVDPFTQKHDSLGLSKSSFKFKSGGKAKVYLLKDYKQRMDISARERSFDSVGAYPIIIENINETDTLYLKVFKGKVLTRLEAFDEKRKRWRFIERATTEKLGYYYYKIHPKEYIYTKVPVYEGSIKTRIRANVIINDTLSILTKPYLGGVNKQQLR